MTGNDLAEPEITVTPSETSTQPETEKPRTTHKSRNAGRGIPGFPSVVGAANLITLGVSEAARLGGTGAAAATGAGALALIGTTALSATRRRRRRPRRNYWGTDRPRSTQNLRSGSGPEVQTQRVYQGSGTTPRSGYGPRTSGSGATGGPSWTSTRSGPTDRRQTSTRSGPDQRTSRTDLARTSPRSGPGGKHQGGPDRRTSGTGSGPRTSDRRSGPTRAKSGPVRLLKATPGMARSAWSKSKPVRSAGRRGWARWVWPAVAAGFAGILRGLKTRSLRETIKRMLEVWKAKRNPGGASETPKVGNKVRVPSTTSTGGSTPHTETSGGADMPTPAYVQATAEMLGAAMMYDPQGMMEVGNDLSKLPQALRNVAETMRVMTQRSNDNDPIHPQIVAMMGELYNGLLAMATKSEDLGPAFRSLHRVDIDRIENGRKNEHMWDIASNR